MTNETRRQAAAARSLCCAVALSSFAGCGGGADASGRPPGEDFPGIGQVRSALLANDCVVTASGIAVVVDAGETATFLVDAGSGNLTLNATQAGGAACEAPVTAAITVTAGTAGAHEVLLDFSNGLFSKAVAANAPKIAINLGSGSTDRLTVRGSSGADHYYLGKGTLAGTQLLNVNGGGGVGEDSLPDVGIAGVEEVLVSTGGGNDIIDASGLYGTTGPYLGALSLFGGANADSLTGGSGNDELSGDSGDDTLRGGLGANVYACGSASDGSDSITVTSGAVDSVDYSQRSAPIAVNLDNTPTSGEAGENDAIPDSVAVVIGGQGNDSLSALGSTRKHTLKGGPGNDVLTGGNGSDTLVGGDGTSQVDGDDVFIGSKAIADYSSRSQALTITINSAGNGGADANDGDPATENDEVRCPHVIGSATMPNTIVGDGNPNHITGGAGADLLVGGIGADTLYGLGQNDTLYGGPGDDSLLGGSGSDALYGGDDNDVLEADSEADFFQCDGRNDAQTLGSAPGNADITIDYTPGSPDFDSRATPKDCEF